jgi:hypothetical protein
MTAFVRRSDARRAYWRTGRHVGRTIYAMEGDKPSNQDLLIGIMDTAELASDVVNAHNLTIEKR